MPPMENIISGKTSVCSRPFVEASRSAAVPGSAAAWPANAVMPPSRCRSANSSTLIGESTRIVPQMKTVGPSTATAPSTAIWPRPAVSPFGASPVATMTVATSAPSTPASASTVCTR